MGKPTPDLRTIADKSIGGHGGFRVMLGDVEIGQVERYFPTWERRTPGNQYVNARGTCKRAEYQVKSRPGVVGRTFRTLTAAAEYLAERALTNPDTEGFTS